MLNYRSRNGQVTGAVWAVVVKSVSNELLVFLAVNLNFPALADPAAQLMEKHADELVGYIRFSPPRCGPQLRRGVPHRFLSPSSQPTSTPNTSARALTS